jgi:tRNA(adenine34) deaminase
MELFRPPTLDQDENWMRLALDLARGAGLRGEVPVGCVIVVDGVLVGQGFNQREALQDPSAHAEILALRQAAAAVGFWRLDGATAYVTLEPCPMCAGALVNARVARLVFGARDPKAGYCGSLHDTVQDQRLNHRLVVTEGVLQEACGAVLSDFFRDLRARRATPRPDQP